MPKRALLITLFTASTFMALAQSGRFVVEAGGAYNKRNISNDSGTFYKPAALSYYNITVRAGYRLSKNWIAGAVVAYGVKDYIESALMQTPGYTVYYTTKVTTTQRVAGLFFRYTHTINPWIFIYGQTEVVTFSCKNDEGAVQYYPTVGIPADRYDIPQEYTATAIRIFPAIGLNVLKGWGIDLNVGGIAYQRTVFSNDNTIEGAFSVTLGQQYSLGLHKFIGRK